MEALMSFFIITILTGLAVLIWCLYKIYDNAEYRTKRVVQTIFWCFVGFLMILAALFSPYSLFEAAFLRGVRGGAVVLFFMIIYVLVILLKALKNKVKQTIKQKHKEAKLSPLKIDIVNNEKYLGLKKSERIAFLRDLYKKTTVELEKQRKEIEKLKDIPDGVAKYIKVKDTSSLKKNITKLENKLVALDELIKAETATDLKVRDAL